jgi:hypothetical protein
MTAIVTGYRLDDWGFDSWQEFFFSYPSNVQINWGLFTQTPIQWVLGRKASLGVMWLQHGADRSPPSSAEIRLLAWTL